MSKINIDQKTKDIFEPIVLTIDEVEYTIDKIPADLMKSMLTTGKNTETDVILAKLAGVPDNTFAKTDTKKLILAMRSITEEVHGQLTKLDSKNVPGESVSQNPK